jgi:hypothetical protein
MTTTPTPTSAAAPPIAAGTIASASDGKIVFKPTGTRYSLILACPGYAGPIGTPVRGVITVLARKILTVPSGGNFIAPIMGPPKTIQGRVRALDPKWMIVQAGTAVRVEFPAEDSCFDLARGPISVGAFVNVVAHSGARFELR